MRLSLVAALLLLATPAARAAEASCSFLVSVSDAEGFGNLTPYWAQEAVGGDLAAAFVAASQQASSVDVGVIDGGVTLGSLPEERLGPTLKACLRDQALCELLPDQHGTAVSSIIVGQSPVGIASRAILAQAASALNPREKPGESWAFEGALKRFLATAPLPPIVNMSMYASDSLYNGAFKSLTESLSGKTIVVRSAGNFFPKMPYRFTVQPPGLVVGSVAPNGLLSDMSQEAPFVTVTAPSNYEIRSYRPTSTFGGRELFAFRGTSGAAPVVTASLANVLSFLPELTLEQAKRLIERTSLKTIGYASNPGMNGAGVVNAYKLARVAERLRARGFDARRESMLTDDATYAFTDEVASLRAEAAALGAGCDADRRRLALLRAALFLAPNEEGVRHDVGLIYRSLGFDAQADFFDASSIASVLADMKTDYDRVLLAIRARVALDGALVGDFAKIRRPGERAELVVLAGKALGRASAPLVDVALVDTSPLVRIKALIFLDDAHDARECHELAARTLRSERDDDVRAAASDALERCASER
ncbi:MAG: S8/S53 family peptidase [Deltaproteobacteria bacterium]|nr:S8/S53 family peptidase [Deltaproteobacteria bacterium]